MRAYLDTLAAQHDSATPGPRRGPYRQRRDAGARRPPPAARAERTGAPTTEGGFSRKREESIAALVAASPTRRRAMRAKGVFGPAAAASAAVAGEASATVRAKVRKRSATEVKMETPEHDAKACDGWTERRRPRHVRPASSATFSRKQKKPRRHRRRHPERHRFRHRLHRCPSLHRLTATIVIVVGALGVADVVVSQRHRHFCSRRLASSILGGSRLFRPTASASRIAFPGSARNRDTRGRRPVRGDRGR